MGDNESLKKGGRVWLPMAFVAIAAFGAIIVSVACLAAGYFIIFQNLFYIPIILACVYYTRRGFAFSVFLTSIYLGLILAFTREPTILLQASVRGLIFVLIAGIITRLSVAQKRTEEALRRRHDRLEALAGERSRQLKNEAVIRARIEEALRVAEIYSRNLIEASLDPLVTISAEGKITDVNAATEKITGMSRERLIGTDFSDYFTDPGKAREGYSQAFSSGIVKNYPLTIRHVSGRTMEVLYNASVYKNRVGEVQGVFAAAHDVTEFKKVERELALAREMQFKVLIGLLPAKVFLKDRNSVYLFCNENYARDLKLRPDEIAGKTDYDLFPTHLAEQYRNDDQQVMESGKTKNIEEEYHLIGNYLSGAQTSYINTVKAPVRDEQGNVTGLLGLFWDITERKKMENEIKESERKIRAVFDQTFQFIGLLTPEGILIEANRTSLDFAGIKESDVLNKPFWETPWWTHSPELQERLHEAVKAAAKGENVFFEASHVARDGFLHNIDFSLKPVRGDNDKVIFLIPEGRDITDRKKAEEASRKHKELLSEMTAQVPGVVFQFFARANGERGFYYVSLGSERVFGIKPDLEKFFDSFVSRVVSEERKDFLRSIDIAVREAREWKYEGVFEKPSGEKIWFSGNSVPVRREKEIIFNGMLTDISDRKKAEAEKQRVEVLTSVVETKSRFTSMVSHELRSPLAVIKEALGILLEGVAGSINDEQKSILAMAKRNGDRLGRLINNVLDFQKIEMGKMEFNFLENDLNEVLTEVHDSMSLLSGRKGLGLRVEVEEGLPKVKFDKDRIIQVLANLTNNAINNTETGGVILAAKKDNAEVHISVQDTGNGISAEDLPKLFHPFEQVDAPRRKQKGGTGLGLAISKEIILAHHGKIWAESEEGKGSVFHFTLPL